MEMNSDGNALHEKNEPSYVPYYRSDNEESEHWKKDKLPKKRGRKPKPKAVKEDKPKRTRGKGNNWLFVKKFDNAKDAEEAVRSENTWSIKMNRTSTEGRKQVYRCNKVKNRGPQCIAQVLLLYDAYSDDVILFRKEFEHDHHLIGIRSGYHGIDPETKRAINDLFELHITKPRIVYNHLMEKPGLKMPTIMQLNNYLNDLRRLKYGCTANLAKAKNWIASHVNVPENEHEAFVISYCVQEASTKICYVLSTKKLLELASRCSVIHADAKCRFNWQNLDLLIVGATDVNTQFYPLCLAISSTDTVEVYKTLFNGLKDAIASMYTCFFEPSVLVCDDEAVGDTFTSIYGLTPQVRTCWTHTKSEIKSAIEQMDEKKQNAILEDIECLHMTTSRDIFDMAAELFLLKWEEEDSFTNYFREEWLVRHRNWYLGASNSSTTNDAIKTINNELKSCKIIYERLPAKRFLSTVCEVVTEWSEDNQIGSFATSYTIQLTDWAEAHHWLKIDRKTTILNSDTDKTIYLVQSSKSPPISRTTYLQSDSLWKTFDEYKEIYFSHWKVTMLKDSGAWKDSKCSCPQFSLKNMCKHVLGLAVQLKYTTIPVEAKKLALTKEHVKIKKEDDPDPLQKPEPPPKLKKVYTLAAESQNKKTTLETVCTKKKLRKSKLRAELETALQKEKSEKRNSSSWSDQSEPKMRKRKTITGYKTRAKRKSKRSVSTSSEQNEDIWSDDWGQDNSRDFDDSSLNIDSTNSNAKLRDASKKGSKSMELRSDLKKDSKNVTNTQEDEFYYFGQSIAAQLRRLPINAALDLQVLFQNEMTKARMKCMNASDNVVHSSTSVEQNPLEGYEMQVILPSKIEHDESD